MQCALTTVHYEKPERRSGRRHDETKRGYMTAIESVDWTQVIEQLEEVYMPKFEIQTMYDGEWSNECPGDPNVFASEYDAEKAIAELKQLGDDWIDAEYRVVAIRDEDRV